MTKVITHGLQEGGDKKWNITVKDKNNKIEKNVRIPNITINSTSGVLERVTGSVVRTKRSETGIGTIKNRDSKKRECQIYNLTLLFFEHTFWIHRTS